MNIFIGYMIFILIILFTHLITINTQSISGKQYFYGIYVKKIELEDDSKKHIDKKFKKKLNLALALVIIIYSMFNFIFSLNIGLNATICITLYLVLYYMHLREAYKEVKIIKSDYLHSLNKVEVDDVPKKIMMDEEIIKEQGKIKKKFIILFGICIGLSVLSFLYVLISYSSMPDVIITHWGSGGRPDGFEKKNIIDVFFTNFIDLPMVIMFAIMGVGSVSSKIYIDSEKLEENRKKAIKYTNGLGYSFLALTLTIQSMTTTIPIFMVQQKNIPLPLTLFGCIAPIFVTVAMIYYFIMLGTLKPKDKSSYFIENDDEKWIYGFIYYNKEDTSFIVEKRLGAGWSMNMAHPLGKLISILLLVIMVASLLIGFI